MVDEAWRQIRVFLLLFSLPSRSLTRYCPLCEVSVLRGGDKTTRVLLGEGASTVSGPSARIVPCDYVFGLPFS